MDMLTYERLRTRLSWLGGVVGGVLGVVGAVLLLFAFGDTLLGFILWWFHPFFFLLAVALSGGSLAALAGAFAGAALADVIAELRSKNVRAKPPAAWGEEGE